MTPEEHVAQNRGGVLSDENDWYSVLGHVRPIELFRAIMSEFGLAPLDLGIHTPSLLRAELGKVRQEYCVFVDADDPTSWRQEEQEAHDDGYWPHDWDQMYMVDPGGTIPITHWRG